MSAHWNDALVLNQRNDAKLFENPPIVLFSVDEPFNAHASPAWSVGDEIFFEFVDSPNANSGMFSLAHFCGRAHAWPFGQLGIGRFNSLAKSLCYIQTGIFSEVNVVNDEVPPSGGALNGACHRSGSFRFLADQFKSLTLHCIEVFFGGGHVIAAFFGFIKEHFQASIEMLVEWERIAALNPLEDPRFGFQQFGNEGVSVRVPARIHLLVNEIF